MPKPVHKPAPKAPEPKALIDGVPVWSLYDEIMPIAELLKRKHPRNDNTHDDLQKLALSHIIRGTGIRKSITLSRLTGRIVAGHGALESSILVPLSAFPVAWQDFDTEEKEIAHLMADNELARMSLRNDMQTAENLDLLAKSGFDLALVGILDSERTDLLALVNEPPPEEKTKKKAKGSKSDVDSIEEVSDELGGAAALKNDMVFESSALFDMPEYRMDMCMEIPTPFDSWAGRDASPPQVGMHYLYNFSSSMLDLPISDSIFSFYEEDKRFDSLWEAPDKWASRILNAGFMGAVAPDYSVWAHTPKAAQIWQVYKAQWVGRYFQECGIKIIPNIQTAGIDTLDFSLAGIPVGVPAISLQYQTATKTPVELAAAKAVLKAVVDTVKPGQVLVYGGDHAQEYLAGVFKKTQAIYVMNRMQKRRKVIAKTFKGGEK